MSTQPAQAQQQNSAPRLPNINPQVYVGITQLETAISAAPMSAHEHSRLLGIVYGLTQYVETLEKTIRERPPTATAPEAEPAQP